MIRRPPRSTPKPSSAASDVYKRQLLHDSTRDILPIVAVLRIIFSSLSSSHPWMFCRVLSGLVSSWVGMEDGGHGMNVASHSGRTPVHPKQLVPGPFTHLCFSYSLLRSERGYQLIGHNPLPCLQQERPSGAICHRFEPSCGHFGVQTSSMTKQRMPRNQNMKPLIVSHLLMTSFPLCTQNPAFSV